MMQKFQLEISITVRSIVDDGVSQPRPDYNNTLRVNEEVTVLSAAGFMEVAKVLGEFHDLSERLRRESIERSGGVA